MTSIASATSSTLPARSSKTFVSTATSAGRLWLAFIIQPHSLVAKFPALGLGQLVTAGSDCCRSDCSGRLLLGSRLAGLHLGSERTVFCNVTQESNTIALLRGR